MRPEPDAQALELQQAFAAFNQLSAQLRGSYELLESRVADLTAELALAHDERLAQLAEKEKLADRLASLLSTLPAGVVVLDSRGYVQEHNPAAEQLLGTAVQGQAWRDIIARAFAPRDDDGHDISLRNGRRVSVSTCPLNNEPGQIILINDVTETRRLQEHVHHNERLAAMGQMAASLAHQIRTPLASALLYSSNLRRTALSDADRMRFADKIISRLKHLENLVNDMLLYARKGTCEREELSVAVLLNALAQSLEAQLVATTTSLSVDDQSATTRVLGNFDMLVSALSNLAHNAIDAMGEGGQLVVGARRCGDHVELHVTDNGPGLSLQAQQSVFEPFHTTRSGGTGLGLAVVAAVATAHDGEVWVRSTPGHGSTFGLRLPCVRAVARAQDRHDRRAAAPAGVFEAI